VIVYSPNGAGLLTGARDRAWLEAASDEDRMDVPADVIGDLVDRLREIAKGVGTTLPELVTAWTLAIDGVTGAICGARRPEQVEGWIRASDLGLDPVVVEALAALAVDIGR
jgi:aryl-alcohol dehydrogenase-like predicted oxidoreductase